MASYGARSLLRRCFWPGNGGREISKTPKSFISPYKNLKYPIVFALILAPKKRIIEPRIHTD